MKTGCRIESPQFTTEEALQPTIALLSIVTLMLLEMRDASRREDVKSRKATEIISKDYVKVLSAGDMENCVWIDPYTIFTTRLRVWADTRIAKAIISRVGKQSGRDGKNFKQWSVESKS